MFVEIMIETDICKIDSVDHEKVERIKMTLPDQTVIVSLADFFKAIGDPTRLKIVIALMKEELCVCDLAALVNITVSGISHQLRILRGLKIVRNRKEGKMVYYSLADNHIENLVSQAQEHILE
jgi:DNA-binding transcriptional ArsR family regulator